MILKIISYIYGAGVWLRNWLYDNGRYGSIEFTLPIISVGNLTAGGTGKTPHIEYLVRLLSPHYQIATLSRGYRRKTHGFVLADEHSTTLDLGDEPMQLHRKFANLSVAVSESRALGISMLVMEHPTLQAILLDDAYQHRAVKPQLSILLTDYSHPFTRDQLLPLGRLREPISQMRRAHIIVVTKCPNNLTPEAKKSMADELKPLPHQQLFFSYLRYGTPYNWQNSQQTTHLSPTTAAVLLCGIAQPQHLQNYLKQQNVALEPLFFADHHQYTVTDLEKLRHTYQQIIIQYPNHQHIILTTEKDATRLQAHQNFITQHQLPILILPIEVYFDTSEQNTFEKSVLQCIKNTHFMPPKVN